MHAHAFNRTRMQEKARAINPNLEAKAKQRLAQRLEAEAEWILVRHGRLPPALHRGS